jgi:hypothetical protein
MKNAIKLKPNLNSNRIQSSAKITKNNNLNNNINNNTNNFDREKEKAEEKLRLTIEKIKTNNTNIITNKIPTKNLTNKQKKPKLYYGEESDEEKDKEKDKENEEESQNNLPIKSKKIESDFNPWNEEINFIQDTGNIKDFLDFCKVNSIKKFNEGKKGIFLNDINEKISEIKSPENLSYREKVNNNINYNINSIDQGNLFDNKIKANEIIKEKENDDNFICNYMGTITTIPIKEKENNEGIDLKNNFNKNKAEIFLNNYSKYNKEDKLQYKENLNNNYDNGNDNNNEYDNNNNNESNKNEIKNNKRDLFNKNNNNIEEINNLFYGKNCFIDILDKLNELSLSQYKVN